MKYFIILSLLIVIVFTSRASKTLVSKSLQAAFTPKPVKPVPKATTAVIKKKRIRKKPEVRRELVKKIMNVVKNDYFPWAIGTRNENAMR